MTVQTPIPFSEAIQSVEDANLRKIYSRLHDIGDLFVVKTPWKGKASKNSLSFPFCTPIGQNDVKSVAQALQNIFSLDGSHEALFEEKVNQAGNGDGSELRRMATLHSSSLCALLHFWNVSKDNRVKICLNGTPVTFSNAFFEVRNRVFEKPSNVDVVLTGRSGKGRPVVLYLESKFSEYIMKSETGKTRTREKGFVSSRYFKLEWLGMSSILQQLRLKEHQATDKQYFFAWEDGKNESPKWLYAEGIKQMIAHYLGICKEIEERFNGRVPKLSKLAKVETKQDAIFYLGIVLFDFCDAFSDKRNDFAILYRKLADELNKLQKTDRLHVVNEILTYSQLQSQLHLSEKTRQFYYGDRNGRR